MCNHMGMAIRFDQPDIDGVHRCPADNANRSPDTLAHSQPRITKQKKSLLISIQLLGLHKQLRLENPLLTIILYRLAGVNDSEPPRIGRTKLPVE